MPDESEHPQSRPDGSLRSPVRPSPPPDHATPAPLPAPVFPATPAAPVQPDPPPEDPRQALLLLRQKTETAVDEYARGLINRMQFNALYQRYNDQRAIIEKLMQRDPSSDAWRQVVSTRGQTGFLRASLEAQPTHLSVYAASRPEPLLASGPEPVSDWFPAEAALRAIWAMPNRPSIGLGRKPLRDEHWLVMAVGSRAATLVVYSLEPSKLQAQWLRDLHVDFERANQLALDRGWLAPERLVFPQRALFEKEL